MVKEIGSEFWSDGPVKCNQAYLLSGRTALEFIICDIQKQYSVRSVLLPSYCCHTMIEPFVRHGLAVRFYDVYMDERFGLSVDIPEICEQEIFYYMTYFGFVQLHGLNFEQIQKKAAVMIEDCTHSWLSRNTCFEADYRYASFRKWTGLDGIALASKQRGVFSNLPQAYNFSYSMMRKQAAAMKRAYIESGIGEKKRFLELFEEAEELLERDYVGYGASAETIASFFQLDTVSISERRRANAEVLINGLSDLPELKLMFETLNDRDVPLFVPILVLNDRAGLRNYLIDHAIYCPTHWPLSAYHEGITKRAEILYEKELSLVCDQRYCVDDMYRVVKLIRDYYKR